MRFPKRDEPRFRKSRLTLDFGIVTRITPNLTPFNLAERYLKGATPPHYTALPQHQRAQVRTLGMRQP
ncbi:MAG: hypothetical protein KAI61_06385 [Alphaproteobacteria bacterium]|nr:hypothetical protein [Alphaproteobacteria bacterium]MCK5556068.1 hypothetical protein [Alphaproteobacteria bacterium]